MADTNPASPAFLSVGAGITPIEHAPVYELIAEQLRRAIHIGTYAPGDKLPNERDLAQRLEVSRASVREAVRVLEGEGYVETRRGATGGIVVLDRAAEEERIGPYIRDMLPRIREIFEFRRAVECEAARLAAIRRTDEHLEQLQAAYEVIESDLETSRFRSADSQFHLGIAEAAGNSWMRDAIETARASVWMPADVLYDRVFRSAQIYHGHILEAIRAKDPDEAAQLMGAHLDATLKDLEQIARLGQEFPARRAAGRSASKQAG
jgi:GntR family transcriptional regulator, transcriptional repressor for pyruvate dehydrogenase complex